MRIFDTIYRTVYVYDYYARYTGIGIYRYILYNMFLNTRSKLILRLNPEHPRVTNATGSKHAWTRSLKSAAAAVCGYHNNYNAISQ